MDAECFICVWDAAEGGDIVQLLGAHSIIHRRRLASGGAVSETGTVKVWANEKYPGEIWGGSEYNREILCVGGLSASLVWFGYMGGDPQSG